MIFHIMDISTCLMKKNQALNALEVYVTEVERKMDIKVTTQDNV